MIFFFKSVYQSFSLKISSPKHFPILSSWMIRLIFSNKLNQYLCKNLLSILLYPQCESTDLLDRYLFNNTKPRHLNPNQGGGGEHHLYHTFANSNQNYIKSDTDTSWLFLTITYSHFKPFFRSLSGLVLPKEKCPDNL